MPGRSLALGSGLFLNWIRQRFDIEKGRKRPGACYELRTRSLFTRTPVLLGYVQQGSQLASPEPRPTSSSLIIIIIIIIILSHTSKWVVNRIIPRAEQNGLPSVGAACCWKRPALASSCLGAENPPLNNERKHAHLAHPKGPGMCWPGGKSAGPDKTRKPQRARLVALDQDMVSHGLLWFWVSGEA